jgi:hypothetical protein
LLESGFEVLHGTLERKKKKLKPKEEKICKRKKALIEQQ